MTIALIFLSVLCDCKFLMLSGWISKFQTALTDARDHVFEMTEKELAVMF